MRTPNTSIAPRALLLTLVASLAAVGGCSVAADDADSTEAAQTAAAPSIQAGLDAATASNEKRMAALRNDPNSHHRDGAEPYLKLHPAGETVKGTVVVFHGFSGKPSQQDPFVNYLYSQGYDVFNASVAGHYKVNVPGGERSFPGSGALKGGGLTPLDNKFVAWPYADYGHDPVKEYNAEIDATYQIMKTLRKPFAAAGLSAGATQAIGIAAKYPKDFTRVIAFTPLLDLEAGKKQQLTQAALVIQTARKIPIVGAGQWDGWFAWDKSNPFPQGCFWGLQKYGQSLVSTASSFKSNKQKLFIVTTAHEDAADSTQTKAFFDAAGGTATGNTYYNYANEQWVPHPVNAIGSRSQNMVNFYYKTLFQEAVRFLDKGTVKTDRLGKQDLAASDRGHTLAGYTAPDKMDWDTAYFGTDLGKAIPAHVDLTQVQ